MKHVNYAIMNPLFLSALGHDVDSINARKKFLPMKFDYDCQLVLDFRASVEEIAVALDSKSAGAAWGYYQIESIKNPNITLNYGFFMYPLQESDYTLVADTGEVYLVDAKTFGLVVSLTAFAHLSALANRQESKYSELTTNAKPSLNNWGNARLFSVNYKYTKEGFLDAATDVLKGAQALGATSRDIEQIKGLTKALGCFVEQLNDTVSHNDF